MTKNESYLQQHTEKPVGRNKSNSAVQKEKQQSTITEAKACARLVIVQNESGDLATVEDSQNT
jgi:hypothetical protein